MDRTPETIFHNARLINNPADRAAYLDNACEGDAELRAEIDALLKADDKAGEFLRTDQHATASRLPWEDELSEGPGTRIGPYKILQRIGEGGFGAVFLAEQSEPVRRRVALKIIKPGMDSRQVIARFEAERQALALMNHPHIARVLDGGLTKSGRPYFVMEYVVGDAITKFADAHKLSVDERLALFTQVCQAVQHAHTKGVIHRDLKPANVLVSMVDGTPFARVIDFGIAKATGAAGERLTDKTLFTMHGQLIGTPEYMSPEQAGGDPDIDTRTDVYALGVLLYELLTGSTPFRLTELKRFVLDDVRKMIREQDPPSPSLRLSRDLDTLAATAAARRVEPGRLGALVKGELDWIVMKALEKDRARRYETATALAADVGRHLSGEAVVAAPPSRVYRVRKFVRKHRGPVVAGSAVGAALLIGFAGTAWGWTAADVERKRAEATSTALRKAMDDVQNSLRTLDNIRRAHLPDQPWIVLGIGGDDDDLQAERLEDGTITLSDKAGAPGSGTAAGIQMLTTQAGYSLIELSRARNTAEWSAYTANLALAQAAMEAGNYPEARERIEACPEGKRGWEWEFLESLASQVDVFIPERSMAAFSPDGRWIATGVKGPMSSSTECSVFDGDTGTKVVDIGIDQQVSVGGFTPDSTALLTYQPHDDQQDLFLRVWDIPSGNCRMVLEHQQEPVSCAAVSEDMSIVVAGHKNGSVSVWDLASGALQRSFTASTSDIWSIALDQHGSHVAVSSRERAVKTYATDSGQLVAECDSVLAYYYWLAIIPEPVRLVGVSNWGPIQVWNLRTGELLATPVSLFASSKVNNDVFALPDMLVVSTSFGYAARTFEPHSGMPNAEIDWRGAEIGAVGGTRDGERLALAVDGLSWGHAVSAPYGTVIMRTDNIPSPERRLMRRGSIPPAISINATLDVTEIGDPTLTLTTPDATRRIVGGSDRTVRFFDVASDREVASIRVDDAVTDLKMTADGTRLVIMLADGSARVWDIRDPGERRKDYERAWAERVPAGAYLDELMAGATPTGELMSAIEADESLTPLRRLVAAEMLQERLADMEHEARAAMRALTKGQTDPAAVRAAAEAVDLPPRVKAMVVEQAAEWAYEPPREDPQEQLAKETRQRRLAEAEAVILLPANIGMTEQRPADLSERLRAAEQTFRELVGRLDARTAEALLHQSDWPDVAWLHAEVELRSGRPKWAVVTFSSPDLEGYDLDSIPQAQCILAMAQWQLALQTEGEKADTHLTAARDALAKARALMAPSPDGTPSPLADDADAKALLAEAEALIEGGEPK